MNLTPLQLECMKLWASKELSFGCLTNNWQYIYLCKWDTFPNAVMKLYEDNEEDLKFRWPFPQTTQNNYSHDYIIWHPITRWRLCYLYWSMPIQKRTAEVYEKFNAMQLHFILPDNTELYNQTILERTEEVNKLVLDFLLSIQ